MREETTAIELGGTVLTEVRTGAPVDLGALPGVQVVTLIRHRF